MERRDATRGEGDTEARQGQQLKYPKSVFFIISNEFCERFCFYGMRTILAIYLSEALLYSQDTATVIYHAFISFAYMTPIIGAIIADSWLGKFRTIFYLSIVYALGSIVISIASMPAALPPKIFSFLGLFLIGLGTGGIKPCVSAFGGDQFVLPAQEHQLQKFFSVFYFAVNSGSFISTFVTPILREDVDCLGEEGCFPLAFGVPAILMIVSIAIFVLGKPMYKIKKPEGNIMLKVCKCIGNAISMKRKSKGEKKEHWLDYAEEKFGKELVEHIKLTLRVLVLFIPLPMYWALFEQQGSRWTFQATRMNGDMGGGFTIKPDQIQVFNPLLILALIPIVETGVYPIFNKLRIIQTPLSKMTLGGCLAGVAFLMSAFVELGINPTTAVLPNAGEAQLRIYNSINNCPVTVNITGAYNGVHEISALDVWENTLIKAKNSKEFNMNVKVKDATLCDFTELSTFTGSITERKALSYMLYDASDTIKCYDSFEENLEKNQDGDIKLRVLFNSDVTSDKILTLKKGSIMKTFTLEGDDGVLNIQEFEFGTYAISIDGTEFDEVYFGMAGVFTYIIEQKDDSTYHGKVQEISPSNKVNIFWQIPQYLTMTTGEVMFSITGLQFAFTQAPLSMKSVVVAGWLLTNAFGNIIVIIVAEAQISDDPMWEFIFFAGLMFVCMLIFFLMSLRYKYVQIASEEYNDGTVDTDSIHSIALEKRKESSHENEAFDQNE